MKSGSLLGKTTNFSKRLDRPAFAVGRWPWRSVVSTIIWACLAGSVLACSAAGAVAAETHGPISLHPENGCYFLWRGKPTILVTSGEHYGTLLNLDFDYERYFATLAADGLNHTRTFSGVYRESPKSFGITDNPLAPRPDRFACPWPRSDQPGGADGGNKFDLSRFDEAYFRRLHQFMAAASRHGIVVEMNLFCPLYEDDLWEISPMNIRNNINGIGDCPRTEVYALKHPQLTAVQEALTRKIVAELNRYDNLYYEVCNEPYFGGVTDAWQHRIVDVIVETEKGLPHRHLISLNIANGKKKVENPHPAVSIFNFHYCVPPDTVAMNSHLNKVIGENETGFRGRHDFLYRSEGWNFLLAGGALYNNLDYSFTTKHPDGTFRDYKSPGGGSPELRRQLGVLKRFLEGFDFVKMAPDAKSLKKASGGVEARVLSQPGAQYAVYVQNPLPNKPKRIEDHLRNGIEAVLVFDLPAGDYQVQWIDVLNGAVNRDQRLTHAGGTIELAPPPFDNDIALRIMAAK